MSSPPLNALPLMLLSLPWATTSGEVWGSRDEGRTWKCLAAHLPEIYAVEVA